MRWSDIRAAVTVNVVVAALGYFVDIFDLLLFGIVRQDSLRDIGVPSDRLLDTGMMLINSQMSGMLVGGIVWGVLGDRRGRLSVLFGSIFIYSIANIGNAFVTSVEAYAVLRFIAGVGLAGELGAAITLVAETLPKTVRGYGTTIVASFGILGAVFAAIIGDWFGWKVCYIVGGVMGLLLLALRVRMLESNLFTSIRQDHGLRKGDLRLLFNSRERFLRYLRCALIGVPVWYVVGILMTFSPELSVPLQVQGAIHAGTSILFCYAGLSIGDLTSGLMSQYLQSRKKSVLVFLILTVVLVALYLSLRQISSQVFYAICFALGFGVGYWAVFVTMAAEQFGTNLRATVATTAPNFVRGAVVPLTLLFQYFRDQFVASDSALLISAAIVGVFSLALALLSLLTLSESFHNDLNFNEH